MSSFPKLVTGQYAVILSELKTGIVLNLALKVALPNDEVFVVFNNFEDAEHFARSIVADQPQFEANIFDSEQEHSAYIKQNV